MARKKNPNEDADKGFMDELDEASEGPGHDARELKKAFKWERNVASPVMAPSSSTEKQLDAKRKSAAGKSTFAGEQAYKINKRRGR